MADKDTGRGKDAPAPEAEVSFTPAPELVERMHEPPDTVHCPQCGKAAAPYAGSNPYKAGTYECPKCQFRITPQ